MHHGKRIHSERIGHGLTAMQDEKLMNELASTKLPVEICVTSNTFTKKVIQKASEHPVADYLKRGIVVTINTDDPVFFKTTLLDEFYICHKELKMTMADIKKMIENSFTASFMQSSDKKAFIAKVNEVWKTLKD